MIQIYDRKNKTYDVEKVMGGKAIKWSYESPVGKSFTKLIIKRKIFSRIYGIYCSTPSSKKRINSFVRNFNIDLNQVNKQKSEFKSFNDFFARTLKSEARPINKNPSVVISPCDGRLLAYTDIDIDNLVQVKHLTYSLKELIGDEELASKYEGGTCLIFRLAPTDYHRFHFIDNGTATKSTHIRGSYYSVNPIALEKIPKLFCQNKREYSIFHSENFGDTLYIEVGASCVGTIVQSYTPNTHVLRGEEKGYFKFGGSTTILFFEKGKVSIDKDIIEQTKKGYECKVILGEKIGRKASPGI